MTDQQTSYSNHPGSPYSGAVSNPSGAAAGPTPNGDMKVVIRSNHGGQRESITTKSNSGTVLDHHSVDGKRITNHLTGESHRGKRQK